MSHFSIAYIKNSNQLSLLSQYSSLYTVDNPIINIEDNKTTQISKDNEKVYERQ
jgi:hypothetical protein